MEEKMKKRKSVAATFAEKPESIPQEVFDEVMEQTCVQTPQPEVCVCVLEIQRWPHSIGICYGVEYWDVYYAAIPRSGDMNRATIFQELRDANSFGGWITALGIDRLDVRDVTDWLRSDNPRFLARMTFTRNIDRNVNETGDCGQNDIKVLELM